jgi:outer membrane protein OmpA-like peptidoglycan-associated protein
MRCGTLRTVLEDGLHEVRVGNYHLLVDVNRDLAWVSRAMMDHERVLKATREERMRMRHITMSSLRCSPGWYIVRHASRYPQDFAHGLGGLGGFEDPDIYHEEYLDRLDKDELVILALLGDPTASVMPIEARPRNDPPRPRHPPYVPPQPLDPGGPTKLKDTFVHEVRLVDELGEPIDDVLLRVADSPPIRTDSDGRIRYDDASSGTALARFPDPEGLRNALRTRWEPVREGDWITETKEHTYIEAADPLPMVRVRSDRPHTIVVQPRILCGRILELLFDTNKTFLLPSALEPLRSVRRLYDKRPRAHVLVVGHTDTTGDPDVNDPLSLNRAKSVVAFLRNDVDTWLDFYGDAMHPKARWGPAEDHLMLDAVLDASGEALTDTPLRHFQATRGLVVDAKLGPNTRRALITEYMAAPGTTVPKDTELTAHGCGPHFPLAPDDPPNHTHDRRVELFFFDRDLGILPPPQAEISPADSPEYPEWRRRAAETHDFVVRHARIIDLLFVDEAGAPIANVNYRLRLADGTIVEGLADSVGRAPIAHMVPGDALLEVDLNAPRQAQED